MSRCDMEWGQICWGSLKNIAPRRYCNKGLVTKTLTFESGISNTQNPALTCTMGMKPIEDLCCKHYQIDRNCQAHLQGRAKNNLAKFSDTCSVRADWLCIGCFKLVGRRKAVSKIFFLLLPVNRARCDQARSAMFANCYPATPRCEKF